ncbi:MAG TPA: hypothetical protein VGO90_02145, partial [Chthoniobacteraceae bacterium]|nr:hypothetical protein [Chthoniobacteraceae bacterium]
MRLYREYKRRLDNKVEADVGRGVFWEGRFLSNQIYDDKGNTHFIPIQFEGAEEAIPDVLSNYTRFQFSGFDCEKDNGFRSLLFCIFGATDVPQEPVGPVPDFLKPEARKPAKRLQAVAAAPLPEQKPQTDFAALGKEAQAAVPADIYRILKYAPAELIGREHELNLLTAALKGDLPGLPAYPVVSIRHRPRVLTFVALGGEGKTSLVAKWAAELAAQDWPGCDAVFAWSFYSQGTREQVAASSDLFLKEALTFFGDDADKEFAASSAGAHEKGQRLARIVGQRRSLLILDGLEPLQYAPTSTAFQPGQLKDQGI